MSKTKAESVYRDFEFHTMLIHRFVDGVTHEESIWQLPFEHNCMNWILGHIVANRSHVLEVFTISHAWRDEILGRYHTETPPVTPESESVQFDQLITYLDESVTLLKPALAQMTDEQIDTLHTNYRGEKSRYDHAKGFHWHEAFHLGQLEILQAFIASKRD